MKNYKCSANTLEILNTYALRRYAIKPKLRFHFILERMPIIKKTKNKNVFPIVAGM